MSDDDELLIVRRTIVEPASQEVLRNRLNSRLADRDARNKRYGSADGWPRCISDGWLQQDIEVLERALNGGKWASETQPCETAGATDSLRH